MDPIDLFWHSPPVFPSLTPPELHLWWVSQDALTWAIPSLRTLLEPAERTRADRFYFERDRNHFTVARGMLRILVGRYLQVPPASVRLVYGERGKPGLQLEANLPPLRFNLSHSGGVAVFGFSRDRELGIDVERIRELSDLDQMARHSFSPLENAVMQGVPPHLRLEAFFNCWSRKEAFIKAVGEGLYRPLDDFDVTLVPGEPARLLATRRNPLEASRWSLEALPVAAEGFKAAVCVDGNGWHPRLWRWPDHTLELP